MEEQMLRVRGLVLRTVFKIMATVPPGLLAWLRTSPIQGVYLEGMRKLSQDATEDQYTIGQGLLSGYKIVIHPDQYERRYLFTEYEPEVVAAIQRHIVPGMTVLDVGAHIGYIAMIMARLVGEDGRCIAFEPLATNVQRIRHAITVNRIPNLEVVQIALGDKDGVIRFAVEPSGFMGHMLGPDGDREAAVQCTDVSVRRLDSILEQLGVGRVGMIKLDVEGAEDAVIRGAERLIREHRPVWVVEVHTFRPASDHARPFVRSLFALDYTVLDLATGAAVEPDTFEGGHILALPRT